MIIKFKNRYDISGLHEGEFEPGSKRRVIKNLLNIKKKRDLDLQEGILLEKALYAAIDLYTQTYHFTVKDICKLHKLWLENVYPWAGNFRQVNLNKAGFQFASAHLIDKLMIEYEENCLSKYTPCRYDSIEKVIEALAITHTELVLIHPFREGNGRIARLLSTLMALQSKLPLLDFTGIRGKAKRKYFLAVQAGLERNYEPMKQVFKSIIKRTVKLYEK